MDVEPVRGRAVRWRVDSGLSLKLAAGLCYLLTRFFEQTKVALGAPVHFSSLHVILRTRVTIQAGNSISTT